MQGGAQFRLMMRRGPQVNRAFPILKEVTTLGRDAANDIVIADPEVSRQHARLVLQPDGRMLIEDLGSTNGTYVNGTRVVAPQPLNPGDTVGLGETITLVFGAMAGDAGETVASMGAVQPAVQPASVTPPEGAAIPPPPPPTGFQPAPAPQWDVSPAGGPPPEPVVPPRQDHRVRNAVLGGCGCLVLLCVLCAVGTYVGDAVFKEAFWQQPPMVWILQLLRAIGAAG